MRFPDHGRWSSRSSARVYLPEKPELVRFGQGGAFWGPNAPESQTLIVLSKDPDTILLPSGENCTDMTMLLWALAFSVLRSSVAAKQASRRQFWARRGDLRPKIAPASQTLIVLSSEPDTIFVPSGEKATDMTQLLCASVFSLLSSSVAAREARNGQF